MDTAVATPAQAREPGFILCRAPVPRPPGTKTGARGHAAKAANGSPHARRIQGYASGRITLFVGDQDRDRLGPDRPCANCHRGLHDGDTALRLAVRRRARRGHLATPEPQPVHRTTAVCVTARCPLQGMGKLFPSGMTRHVVRPKHRLVCKPESGGKPNMTSPVRASNSPFATVVEKGKD